MANERTSLTCEFYLLTLGVFYEEVYWLWPSNSNCCYSSMSKVHEQANWIIRALVGVVVTVGLVMFV